jgi:peptidoglycan-associated lipoprotein
MSKNKLILAVAVLVSCLLFVGCPKPPPPVVETPPPVTAPAPEPEPIPTPVEPPPFVEDITAQLQAVLQTIYFDFDKYDLTPDAISKLGTIASFISSHPQVRLMAEGHCDERGSSEYNMGLGENRAKAVKNYLSSYGVSSDRIETTSYGEERTVRQNCGDDESCNGANRRVEWQILAK